MCFQTRNIISCSLTCKGLEQEQLWGELQAGGGGTPYNGLYGNAPPKRSTFFKPQVYERVGISLVKVYERVGKSVISKMLTDTLL